MLSLDPRYSIEIYSRKYLWGPRAVPREARNREDEAAAVDVKADDLHIRFGGGGGIVAWGEAGARWSGVASRNAFSGIWPIVRRRIFGKTSYNDFIISTNP